jgi:hypothetical protein
MKMYRAMGLQIITDSPGPKGAILSVPSFFGCLQPAADSPPQSASLTVEHLPKAHAEGV